MPIQTAKITAKIGTFEKNRKIKIGEIIAEIKTVAICNIEVTCVVISLILLDKLPAKCSVKIFRKMTLNMIKHNHTNICL